MKKDLRKMTLARETLRQLDPSGLKAAGAQPPPFTSDITNCYICPVYSADTQ